jgi:hypothetical protein
MKQVEHPLDHNIQCAVTTKTVQDPNPQFQKLIHIKTLKAYSHKNTDSQQWNNSIPRAKMAWENHVAYRNAYKILIHNLELLSSG